MNDNLLWTIESISLDELKKEIDGNSFVDKKLKDYENGKKTIDNFVDIRKMDNDVQKALILYAIYKIKGGN